MPVTTRNYIISQSAPFAVLNALSDAFIDLGYADTASSDVMGYLTAFTNTSGVTRLNKTNERYLVSQSSTTGVGSGSLFDILRNPFGAISTVTLVTGGSGYELIGRTNVSSSGVNLGVTDVTGIVPGMVVTRIAGTGALQSNTVVTSVTAPNTVVINQVPSTPLSAATVTFADTITISGSLVSGSEVTQPCTGSTANANILVTDPTTIFPGQVVTGSVMIFPLTTVSSVQGNIVTLNKTPSGSFSGSLTFKDDIIVTVTGVANEDRIPGTVTPGAATITNVPTNANVYVGAEVKITSGSANMYPEDGRVFISAIGGSGPYTLTLRNESNTFKGFNITGSSAVSVQFRASKGNTSRAWFAYDTFTSPLTYAWGVLKQTHSNDKLGSTFWVIYVGVTNALGNFPFIAIRPATGFNPVNNTLQGVSGLDWVSSTAVTNTAQFLLNTQVASSVFAPAILRTRQSELDNKFTLFTFLEGNNTKFPFFFPSYNNALQPWSLNDVFLGGVYEVFQSVPFNALDSGIVFRMRMSGIPKRMAETGYSNYNLSTSVLYTNTFFRSTTGNRIAATPTAAYEDVALYSRQYGDLQTEVPTTISVFKKVPINPHFLPVPYYLPDDFVLVEVPWQNATVNDTVTVSPSEIYTIVQAAINQTSFTTLALAARTT